MFGPLSFQSEDELESTELSPCILCEDKFNLHVAFKIFVQHLFEAHHVVIEDVQHIENLPKYLDYWRNKLSSTEIERIVPSVKVGSSDNKYFLLSSLLKDDKELRHKIKLEHILDVQTFERTDANFKRKCLFCSLELIGTRPAFIEHLFTKHNLVLGDPQNLVFIDELVNVIEEKLDGLECLYCKKTFPDKSTLKEHMRKKMHKMIHPMNKSYDKYYMVNYLEPEKNWESLEKEQDDFPIAPEDNSDEEYSDWNEKSDLITCLLCEHKEVILDTLVEHMKDVHQLDFSGSIKNLDFYQRVKLVNYVRRQVLNSRCIFCDANCADNSRLLAHIKEKAHSKIPAVQQFDQPEYFFPTYENDSFLYLLEDVEETC